MSDNNTLEYKDRAELDNELESAIADILSAEAEARSIVEQAEASVKAIQLDGATRERDMRTQSVNYAATQKDRAIKDAEKRAEAKCAELKAAAEKDGEALLSAKKKEIAAVAAELFKSLGGK